MNYLHPGASSRDSANFKTRPEGVPMFLVCLDVPASSRSSSHTDWLWLKPETDFTLPCQVLACLGGEKENTENQALNQKEHRPLQTRQLSSWHWCRTIQLNLIIWPTHVEPFSVVCTLNKPQPHSATLSLSPCLPLWGVCIGKWPVK